VSDYFIEPSAEAVSDAWCELHDGLPSGCSQALARKALTAAYAIDFPARLAEAQAAGAREQTEKIIKIIEDLEVGPRQAVMIMSVLNTIKERFE
jgi:hypothetical protein